MELRRLTGLSRQHPELTLQVKIGHQRMVALLQCRAMGQRPQKTTQLTHL